MIKQIKWMLSYIEKQDKQKFAHWLIFCTLLPLLEFLNVFMLLKFTNCIQRAQVDNYTIALTVGMGLTVMIGAVLDFLAVKSGSVLKSCIVNSFSGKMYRLFCNEELLLHSGRSFSEILASVRTDCENCSSVFINIVRSFIQAFVWAVYAFVMVYKVKWIGIVAIFALVSTAVFSILKNKRRIYQCGEQIRESRIRLNSLISTSYGAYKELKIDSRRENLQERYKKACCENAELEVAYSSASKLISQSVKTLISSGIYFGLAILLLISRDTQSLISTAILLISVLAKLIPLTSGFIGIINSYISVKPSYKKLRENMERYKLITEEEVSKQTLRKKELTFNKGIDVKNLNFKYPGGKVIFENASFFFPAGKKIAIIGASGAGKTTLLDLLLGLLPPDSGSIKYDSFDIVSGRDENGACFANLGDTVSYIPQTVYLNGSTVRENVVFLSENDTHNDEKIKKCLLCADMLNDVEEMPKGLDSVLGENGVAISGGQRQRLALARALYKDFEILVMDEATAALDVDTEKAVIDTIGKLQKGKTLLMVTHHKSLVEQCDIVYRINERNLERIK